MASQAYLRDPTYAAEACLCHSGLQFCIHHRLNAHMYNRNRGPLHATQSQNLEVASECLCTACACPTAAIRPCLALARYRNLEVISSCRAHACPCIPLPALVPHGLEHIPPTSQSNLLANRRVPFCEPLQLALRLLLFMPAPDPLKLFALDRWRGFDPTVLCKTLFDDCGQRIARQLNHKASSASTRATICRKGWRKASKWPCAAPPQH